MFQDYTRTRGRIAVGAYSCISYRDPAGMVNICWGCRTACACAKEVSVNTQFCSMVNNFVPTRGDLVRRNLICSPLSGMDPRNTMNDNRGKSCRFWSQEAGASSRKRERPHMYMHHECATGSPSQADPGTGFAKCDFSSWDGLSRVVWARIIAFSMGVGVFLGTLKYMVGVSSQFRSGVGVISIPMAWCS